MAARSYKRSDVRILDSCPGAVQVALHLV